MEVRVEPPRSDGSVVILGRLLAIILFPWIVGVTFASQGYAWFAPLLGFSTDDPWVHVYASLIQTALVALPLLPLAWRWPDLRLRAIFKLWLTASLLPLFTAPTRLLPPTAGQSILAWQIAILGVYAWIVLSWLYRKHPTARLLADQRGNLAGFLAALSLALVCSWPWPVYGALGSLLDIGLSLALGLLAGWLAAGLLAGTWIVSRETDTGRTRSLQTELFWGGWATGLLLMLVASGLSYNGVQLLLMIALPSLGWCVLGAASFGRQSFSSQDQYASAVLAGIPIFMGVAFIDPDPLLVALGDPAVGWGFLAAFWAGLTGLAVSLVLLLAIKKLSQPSRSAVLSGIAAALAGIGILALYLVAGQPGFYGDRLFVVLSEQADLSDFGDLPDLTARRTAVYQRLTAHAQTSQAALRQSLQRLGIDNHPYYLVNALEVDGGLLVRLWLNTRSDVDRVLYSPRLRPLPHNLNVSSGSEPAPQETGWNLKLIRADQVWKEYGVNGNGVVIGQSDSGVQVDHPELQDNYRGLAGEPDYNWYDPWFNTSTPTDWSGHGTHTLGSIVGKSVGVAPGATWFACANLVRNLGNPALYLDCLQYMLAPFPPGGDPLQDGNPALSADVLNNSWGCPESFEGCDAGTLLPAARALRAAGIFVVVSAGNDGPACASVTDPLSLYDEVLSVGAVDYLGELASFSSRGPVEEGGSELVKPDLAAPGVDVLSAYPGGTYEFVSGTSMAGPHVAGVIALMWSANPALIGDIDSTEEILTHATQPINGFSDGIACGDPQASPNNLAGFGLIDAFKAVELAIEQK